MIHTIIKNARPSGVLYLATSTSPTRTPATGIAYRNGKPMRGRNAIQRLLSIAVLEIGLEDSKPESVNEGIIIGRMLRRAIEEQ